MQQPHPAPAFPSGQAGRAPSGPREVPLGRRLWGTALLLAAGLLTLTAIVVAPSVTAYRASQGNLLHISRLRQVLEAANRLSAERGPANVMMSIAPGSDPAAAARLDAFRAASDGALAALRGPAAEEAGHAVPARLLSATAVRLQAARRDVDRVAGLQAAERDIEDITGAVARMIAAADAFQDVVAWEIQAIGRADPALAGAALTGHAVSDLREYGGRIGSAIIPAVAVRRPSTPASSPPPRRSVGASWNCSGSCAARRRSGRASPSKACSTRSRRPSPGRGSASSRRRSRRAAPTAATRSPPTS
ncbi:hypothetical protein [Methylobacterium aquaticum]|uniref:hypothetical protein n=1 Tax=Methylobacterium aquaticum TaxID=270351 RepID=UPI001FEFE448|nr:hypothetical protein [Methylobacterium aquaticum]